MSARNPSKAKLNWLKSAAVFLISIILLIGCLFWVGFPDFNILLKADIFWLFVGGLGIVTSLTAMAWRWNAITEFIAPAPPLYATLTATSSISFLGMLLPKEIVEVAGRTWWLKKRTGLSYATGGASVIVDRLLDIFLLLLGLPSALLFVYIGVPEQAAFLAWGMSILFGLMVLRMAGLKAFIRVNNFFTWAMRKIKLLLFKKLDTIVPTQTVEMSSSTLYKLFFVSIFKFLSVAFYYWAFFQAIAPGTALSTFILIIPAVQLFFALSFTAGGMGILEIGWYATLSLIGVDKEIIGAYLVAQRLFLTVALFLIALMLQIGYIFCNVKK